MATFKFLVAAMVALAAMIAAVHANQYQVVWSYDNADCNSPALTGSFMSVPTCEPAECSNNEETTCANSVSEVVPSDGSKGTFLVQEYFDDSSCSGEPTGGSLYVTDKCVNFFGTGYKQATCSDGKAILKSCTDAGCTDCTTDVDEPVDQCHSTGSSSYTLHCSSASSLAISAAAVFAVAIAAVFSVAF